MKFIESIGLSEFIAIDLETSGLNPKEDKIIEISAYKFSKGKPVKSFTQLINPQIKLSNTVTQITGITDKMLSDQPYIEDIRDDFIAFIDNLPIVGHSIMFDLSFFKNNLNNYDKVFNDRMICDTFYLSKIFYYYLSSFSLSSLCQIMNIPIMDAHRAEEDAKNSGLLFIEILKEKISKTDMYTMQKLENCIKNYKVPNRELFHNTLKYLLGDTNNKIVPLSNSTDKKSFFSLDYKCEQSNQENILIDNLFSSDGILKEKFKLFEIREEQIKFCKDIF